MRKRTARFVRTTAFSQGLLGGNRFWRGVFFVMLLGRLRKRAFGREPVLVAREVLVPGESVRLSALGRRRRRGKRRRMRKKAMKAAIAAQT